MSSNSNLSFGDPTASIEINADVTVYNETIRASVGLGDGHVSWFEPVLTLNNVVDEGPLELNGHGILDVYGNVSLETGLFEGNVTAHSNFNLEVESNTQLNVGAIYIQGGSTMDIIDAGHNSTLINNSPIGDDSAINLADAGTKLVIGVTVSGNGAGAFNVNQGATLEFGGEVKNQTIALGTWPAPLGGTVILDRPMQFINSEVDAYVGGKVELANAHETGFSYLNDILKVYDGNSLVSSFKYQAAPGDAFTVSNSGHDVVIAAIAAPMHTTEHPTMASLMQH